MTSPTAHAAQAPGPRKARRHRKAAAGCTPTARSPSGQSPSPLRQCASCRKSRPQDALVQLQNQAVPTPEKIGRGGKAKRYVCVDATCMKQLGKSLGGAAGAALMGEVEALARARFVGMLGLCRRQGLLLVGAGRITDPKSDADGLTIFTASDLAERTRRQLVPFGALLPCMLDAAALGRAVGGHAVGALGLAESRLSLRAAYWLRVWYEARRVDGPQPPGGPGETDPATPANPTKNDGRIEVAR